MNAPVVALSGRKKAHEIFGTSHTVLPDSYVDRAALDGQLQTHIERPTHVALRGQSMCGKSWLRQMVLPDALVAQCRLKKTTLDLYRDALSQLDVRLDLETVRGSQWTGRVESQGDFGIKLLAKLGIKTAVEVEKGRETKSVSVGHDVADLRFIADLLRASERRLVIEDFSLSFARRTAYRRL